MEKYWRFKDKKEFEYYAVNYLKDKLIEYKNSDSFDNTDIMLNSSYNLFFENVDGDINSDVLRSNLITIALKILSKNIKDWIDFSLHVNNHDYKEIITRSILNNVYKCDYMCYSFIVYDISESDIEFIEDLIYTASKYFKFEDFNDDAKVHNEVVKIINKDLYHRDRNKTSYHCRMDTLKLSNTVINKIINQ